MTGFAGIDDKRSRDGLQDHENRLTALEQPKQPQAVYVSPATTAAGLVSAARYPNCQVWLSALMTFAVSDGVDWIRQDTQGAL